MKNLGEQTIGNIVAANYKTAFVFEQWGIDYCCGGKRKLDDVCAKMEINQHEVESAIFSALETAANEKKFNEMPTKELIEYIMVQHHLYIKMNMSVILGQLQKVANKHGQRYPNMVTVAKVFEEMQEELLFHLAKEEQVLFPILKELEVNPDGVSEQQRNFVNHPIAQMEHEHDHAGAQLKLLSNLTNGYSIPEDACTTFTVSLKALKEFEDKLHEHVHLENNILFPRAGVTAMQSA
ncbi:MAG: hypothetical protein RLY16_1711 [Bacteroidota bacterium]|jgi:regulator of cell morphogenesis and NO signaling